MSFPNFSLCMVMLLLIAAIPVYGNAETFGAPESDELGPIGGEKGYQKNVTKGDFTVSKPWELIDALEKAKPGQVVYVADDAEIDMTISITVRKKHLVVPAGVTLASGRGYKGSKGALILSDELNTMPLIETGGNNVRITGLRIQGVDQKTRQEEIWYMFGHPELMPEGTTMYALPVSRGIFSIHNRLEVDNCEIYGFTHAGIYTLGEAHIHHCNIHHCQRESLGYCVCLGNGGVALIEMNKFDYTRHAIAGTGRPGTAYEARYNWCGPHSTNHVFDMHGSTESNGQLWGGKNIAGEWIKIHHNTFESQAWPAVGIRGIPRRGCEVHHNWFVRPGQYAIVHLPSEKENTFIHSNICGEDKRPCDAAECTKLRPELKEKK